MLRNRILVIALLLLLFSVVSVTAQDVAPEATEAVVDVLPGSSGQVIVVQSDELADGGVVVVPVQAEDDDLSLRELAFAGIAGVLLVLIILDRGRIFNLITNTLDQAYESVPAPVGDMIKDALETGIAIGRDAAAITPGTLDDEAIRRLVETIQTGLIDKLQRDGQIPYPGESAMAFQARRETKG